MASKSFALVEGEPERLELKWRGRLKDLVVLFDGVQLNAEPFSQAEVNQGQVVTLPDGSRLIVARDKNQLQVTRDGSPVPGSATHPKTQARGASTILWVIAGLTLVLGIIIYADTGEILWLSVGSVVLFGVLGFFVRNGSLAALWVGIVVYSIDALFSLLAGLGGGGLSFSTMVIKVFLIVGLVRALPAMRQLQAAKAT